MNALIDPKSYVASGTGFHSFVGWSLFLLVGPIIFIATVLATAGTALVFWLIALIMYSFRIKKAMARLKGSAVKVDEFQFPEIAAAARTLSANMGLSECPEIYVVEDNQQNAFAIKQGSKRVVVLIDDLVHGAFATGNVSVLRFLIAHELAHHALGHTHTLRAMVSSYYLPLSRLDEFSCDAVAHAVVADPAAARDALALLLVGPQLFQRVNKESLDAQAREVAADRYSKKAEGGLTHPLLLRRYARLQESEAGASA
jgi:Zn-dependent protease with chaperone function